MSNIPSKKKKKKRETGKGKKRIKFENIAISVYSVNILFISKPLLFSNELKRNSIWRYDVVVFAV